MSPTSHSGAGAKGIRSYRRSIIAASLGNSFEWYDFTIYALFSIYIAKAFFPGGDPSTGLINAFLAFGLGFLVRPLGSIVLGAYGDAAGRKALLNASLAVMVLGTAILGLAPPYAAIGIGAPILILVGRSLQGFSAGGEFGGAAAFLLEHAPDHRKGEFTSWLQSSMGLSNIMGAVMAFCVTSLFSETQIRDYAWRLPFLFGLLIGPIGLWMRKTIEETGAFTTEKAERAHAGLMLPGVRLLFRNHLPTVMSAVGLSTLLTVASYVLVIFMPVYVQRTFHFAPREAFLAAVIGNSLLVASCFASGCLSDRIGRRPVLLGAALALSVCPYPLLHMLEHHHSVNGLILVQSVFCIATGAFTGAAPSAISERFPVAVRSLGVSISYNLAVMIFSGFAPAALTWITSHGGGALTPAFYLSLAACIAAPSILTTSTKSRLLQAQAFTAP